MKYAVHTREFTHTIKAAGSDVYISTEGARVWLNDMTVLPAHNTVIYRLLWETGHMDCPDDNWLIGTHPTITKVVLATSGSGHTLKVRLLRSTEPLNIFPAVSAEKSATSSRMLLREPSRWGSSASLLLVTRRAPRPLYASRRPRTSFWMRSARWRTCFRSLTLVPIGRYYSVHAYLHPPRLIIVISTVRCATSSICHAKI